MRGVARRNNSTRQGAVARMNQRLNNLKIQTNGTKFTPANNPPDYVEIPWNQYTWERTDVNDSNLEILPITVENIINQIRNRLNISDQGIAETGNVIKLRILDVASWGTAAVQTTGIPDLKMRVYELNPSDALTARTTLRDVGTLNMPAKLGYKFPVTDSRQILSDVDGAIQIATLQPATVGTRVTTRVHVLWKSTYVSDP